MVQVVAKPQERTQPNSLDSKVRENLAKDLKELSKQSDIPADSFGTANDTGVQFVRQQYDALVAKHKPSFGAQTKLLQQKIAADGDFDPIKYSARMEEFQQRTKEEGVGILPKKLEVIRSLLKKSESDASVNSDLRKSSANDAEFVAKMKESYQQVVVAVHQFENPGIELTPKQESKPDPVAPKANLKVDTDLAAQFDELEKKMPKDVSAYGTENDAAMKFVEEKYNGLVAKNTLSFGEQTKMLQKLISADGSFDPIKYQARMEEFQTRTAEEGVGILPPNVENVRTMFKKAKKDSLANSEARQKLSAGNDFGVTYPALMRQNYRQVLEAIHKLEKLAK